jgi:DNA repair ATPase RecN
VYNQCEFYLTGNRINTSTNILKWLQQLETITSRNSKIDFYRSQIKAYDYYSEQFINKVNSFCNTTEFDENVYSQLKTEANTMPRLNNKYKNNTKFNQIKQQSVAKLEIAYRRWAEQDSEL